MGKILLSKACVWESERQSVIKKFKLCFHCLNSGHRVSACRFYPKQLCGVKGCQRFHHRLLHPSTKSTVFYEDRDSDCSTLPDLDQINFDDLESGSDNSDEVPEQSETFHTDVFGVARDGAISLQTLVCDIRTKSGTKQVVVLLDSGSNSTLIDQALASKLKATDSGYELSVCLGLCALSPKYLIIRATPTVWGWLYYYRYRYIAESRRCLPWS